QLSAIPTLWPERLADPTAMQAVAELHETALKDAPEAPGGNGTVWSVQLVPFQRSASGRLGNSENPAPPPAVHAVAEVHEPPRSVPNWTPVGSGTVWRVQFVPFQAWADGCCRPSGLIE